MILLEGGAERAWSEMEAPYDTAEAERERETFLLQTLLGFFFFFKKKFTLLISDVGF